MHEKPAHADVGAVSAAAPPVLALGVFERVGSNWLSDSLRPLMPQHNEPFRQQLGSKHPLSPVNRIPAPKGLELGGLGRHHLVCALSDLHGQPRHLVKETNLFFSTAPVLGLLPDSPVLVLTRAPVGIAASFARGRLWERWRYAERYDQVSYAARTPDGGDLGSLVPQDAPPEPVALGRLIALNALLLAKALEESGRPRTVVSYERQVLHPEANRQALARALGIEVPAPDPAGTVASADQTFATTVTKYELVAELDPRSAALVSRHVSTTLSRARDVLPPQVVATASHWLSGDSLYEIRSPAARQPAKARPEPAAKRIPAVHYRSTSRASWRNLLVTNIEMAEMLNALLAAGARNTRSGTNLLVCPMPHERGGRLRFDVPRRRWLVSTGYEQHPAYWVTWVGAAVFAAWSGARLPTRAEALEATAKAQPSSNCDYAVGDTSPVPEPGVGPGGVHHMVGNLQIWCADGPDQAHEEPLQRYLFGAAWNTPSTRAAVEEVRSRYLLGSSRGVGVRLVRDDHTRAADELGAWELAERLNRWVSSLHGSSATSAGASDRRLVSALTSAS